MKNLKSIKLQAIMKKAWFICKQAVLDFGGKASQYLSEALKQVWEDVKTSKEDSLNLLVYTKENGEKHFTIIIKYAEKINKKLETYLQALNFRGQIKNYKNYEIRPLNELGIEWAILQGYELQPE